MYKKLFLSLLLLLLIIGFTGCEVELDNAGGMISGAARESSESAALDGNYTTDTAIVTELRMKAADAVIGSTADKLAEGSFRYNPESMKPEFDVSKDKIDIFNKSNLGFNLTKTVNKWDLKLTDRLPLDFRMNADASTADVDLSGMAIADMKLDMDASSTRFSFNKPNREVMNNIDLKADASNVDLYGFGDGRYESMEVKANASKLVLDLTGEYKADARVSINADASTIRLKLPDNVGIRLKADKFEMSTLNIKNDNMLSLSNDEYVSKNYDEADVVVDINLNLGITTVTVE